MIRYLALALLVCVASASLANHAKTEGMVFSMCSKMGYETPEPSITSRHLLAEHKQQLKTHSLASYYQRPKDEETDFDRNIRLATLALRTGFGSRSQDDEDGKTIKVGVAQYQPYAFKDPITDEWSGFSVEVFKLVAESSGWQIEWVEGTVAESMKRLELGHIDTYANGIFVTTKMKELHPTWEFSTSFWLSGMSVLVKHQPPAIIPIIFNSHVICMLGYLALFLLLAGTVMWLLERDPTTSSALSKNGDMVIPNDMIPGILTGAWFTMATMTTVGYGDITPKTWPGRFVALLLTISSLFVVGMFTAEITTAVVMSEMEQDAIKNWHELDHMHIGVVSGSMPYEFMTDRAHSKSIVHEYDNVREAAEAMMADPLLIATVGLSDSLAYQSTHNPNLVGHVRVAGFPFRQHTMAFPVPDKKDYASAASAAIIQLQSDQRLDNLVEGYFYSGIESIF